MKIFIDGCCIGNQYYRRFNRVGAAAIIVFNDYGRLIYQNGIRIGNSSYITSNIMEYFGLMLALDYIEENGFINDEITIFSDSQLMVNQVNGRFTCRSVKLLPFYIEAVRFLEGRENIKLEWISREQNTLADELSKEFVCEK